MKIELIYVNKNIQKQYYIMENDNISVRDVINKTGILKDFKEINLNVQLVGIFSKVVTLEQKVKNGDRIEIYRPLTINPKEARKIRSLKKNK